VCPLAGSSKVAVDGGSAGTEKAAGIFQNQVGAPDCQAPANCGPGGAIVGVGRGIPISDPLDQRDLIVVKRQPGSSFHGGMKPDLRLCRDYLAMLAGIVAAQPRNRRHGPH
jgi:hypothetical protein